MRGDYISVTWTPEVGEDYARLLVLTLADIYEELRKHFGRPGQFDPLPDLRVFGSWFIPDMPESAAYASTEWYTRKSLDEGKQNIIASRYLNTVRLEPWQTSTPHFDMAMTSYYIVDDLSTRPSPERILGFTHPGMMSLVTAKPFESIVNRVQREAAIHRTVGHYFGRLFGVPFDRKRQDTVTRDGVITCANVCALRAADTLEEAVIMALQEHKAGSIYCEACQRELVALITSYHFGPS